MSTVKNTVIAVALITAAGLTAVPAYAHEGQKPEAKAEHAEKAKAVCTPSELDAFVSKLLAAKKAEAARKAEHKSKHEKKGNDVRRLRLEGTPEQAGEAKAEAAHKAEKAKKRAAEERAYAMKKLAKACAADKAERIHKAKKEAERKARARKFQAIGIVVSTDSGSVTVKIKAGSPDLHRRKLPIIVTDQTTIKVDGESGKLADLVPGTYVSVHGLRSEGSLTAFKINAATPGVEDEAPVATPTPTPSATAESS